jgi:hypothetical protein
MKIAPRFEIECTKCRGSVIETKEDTADDPLFYCVGCGNWIGPRSAIQAALRGEAHTPLGAFVVYKDDTPR